MKEKQKRLEQERKEMEAQEEEERKEEEERLAREQLRLEAEELEVYSLSLSDSATRCHLDSILVVVLCEFRIISHYSVREKSVLSMNMICSGNGIQCAKCPHTY